MSLGFKITLWLLLAVNLTAFVLFGIDKAKAPRSKWRISEFTLLCWAFFGGAFGAWAGMKCFHHKTLHKKFSILIPMFMLMQTGAFFYFYSKL